MDRISPPLRKWLVGIALVVLVLYMLARVVTEVLWFSQVGYTGVYTKILGSQILLSAVIGAVSFGAAFWNLRLARRKPKNPPTEVYIGQSSDDFIDKSMVEEHVDKGILIASIVVGAIFLLSSLGRARLLLEWSGSQSFGIADPQYGRDISFYVFRLPFYGWILHWLGSLAFLVTVLTGLMHFYENRVFLSARTLRIVPGACEHLAIAVGVVLILKALGYYLEQYALVLTSGPLFFGAGYTDLAIRLPLVRTLMVLCVAAAVVIYVLAKRDVDMRRVGYVLGALIAVGLLSRGVNLFVQGVIVTPDQQNKEAPYIQRAITATRQAFLLDDIQVRPYEIDDRLTLADLDRHKDTLDSVRLWDHRPLLSTYAQQEQITPYYTFTDVDVDRYEIAGRLRQVMIAPRELYFHGLPPEAKTWVNQRLTYTHGYGIAMSPVNEKTPEGWPHYFWSGIPPKKDATAIGEEMKLDQPGIYFGEFGVPETAHEDQRSRMPGPNAGSMGAAVPPTVGAMARPSGKQQQAPIPPLAPSEYVLVGGTTGGEGAELDYPMSDGNRKTTYAGKDGVRIGSAWRKLLFAIRFRDPKLFFTPLSPDSRVLMHRHIIERAQRICPYLAFDSDPYIMIDDQGGLKWVLDAYSYTNRYPYSAPAAFEYYGWRQSVPVNYARNSVKVVVDAYDGTVTFYRVDEQDPITACYAKLFPGLFRPASEIPEDVRRHLRFPRSMFLWQARGLEVYHMTDPSEFYTKEDQWARAREVFGTREPRAGGNAGGPGAPAGGGDSFSPGGWQSVPSEPYFVLLPDPDSGELQFMMIMPIARVSRPNMAAWMGAWWDEKAGRGRAMLYTFQKDSSIYGPMQVENRIDQDPVISQDLTLWNNQGSQVIRGNLIAVPIERTILWVEPIYIQGSQEPLPSLKKIVVVFGGRVGSEGMASSKVAMADTFDEAVRLALTKASEPADAKSGAKPTPAQPARPVTPPTESATGAASPETAGGATAEDQTLQRLDQFLSRSEDRRRQEIEEIKALRELLAGSGSVGR